jgi:hypothetical protein
MARLRLFHATTEAAAASIFTSGFRDSTLYIDGLELTGVWLSDIPLDRQEGTKGTEVLVVDLPEELLADYELIEDEKTYREFCVPSGTVNRYPIVRLSAEDALEAAAARWGKKGK